jgi:drug/metabolite transporter (DMT)-like permease
MPAAARSAVLTACILWALSFVATKVALEQAPALVVVSLRLVLAALCFAPWLARPATLRRLADVRVMLGLLGLSLCGASLHFALQTVGLQFTTASRGALYVVTGPITILLISAVVLSERVSLRKAAGIVLAAAGVVVVMGPDTVTTLRLDGRVVGDLLVLASIVLWGLFTVFGKRLADQLGAFTVSAVATVLGALCMLPVGWVEAGRQGFVLHDLAWSGWLAIGFLGAGCSFLATLLYFVALERSESQKVGAYLYTIPPMTAAFALVLLGETLTVAQLVGTALVIAGVALTERG